MIDTILYSDGDVVLDSFLSAGPFRLLDAQANKDKNNARSWACDQN